MLQDDGLQKFLCLAYDTSEQVWKPTVFTDGLTGFVVDFGLLDFQYLCFFNARYESQIRCSVPFLPCGVICFDFGSLGIVLTYLFCGEIHAVLIKHFLT